MPMARRGIDADGRMEVVGLGNAEAADQRRRHGMRSESRKVLALGISFVVVLFLGMLAPTYLIGHNSLTFEGGTLSYVLAVMSSQLQGLIGVFTGNAAPFETRFMGVIVGAAGGCALGLCGSTYQGAFNNPLAAPKTLGVMAGGALGALVWVLGLRQVLVPELMLTATSVDLQTKIEWDHWLFQNDIVGWLFSHYGACLCSVTGCFAVVGIVMGITSLVGRGRLSNILVVVCGTVISTAVTGIINFLRYSYSVNGGIDEADALAEIENYSMMGVFTYDDFFLVVVPLIAGIAVVLALRNRLTLLSFGDDVAQTMGMNVNRSRYLMIFTCTFLTAWAISFCGHIPFLGFISAHLARKIVGPDFRWLLPASVFTGGILITVILYLAQSGLPYTSPYSAGTICSIVGGVLFLILAVREGRGAARG